MTIDASVIIPTHNRRAWVQRAVSALMRQDHPRSRYEVIVVCDRCTDGTQDALRTEFGDAVRLAEGTQPGQAAALNQGAGLARGDILIFLDDETEPVAGFISAYVDVFAAHRTERIGVVGYSPVASRPEMTPFDRETAREYDEFYDSLREPGRASTPLDLAGCNFALTADALREAGGFNEGYFFQRNDFELATRLLERGYRYVFCPAARAEQYVAVTPNGLVERANPRAANDLRLGREHPWSAKFLSFYVDPTSRGARLKRRLAWSVASLVAPAVAVARRVNGGSVRLTKLEYRARYFMALRAAGLSWAELIRMCEAGSQPAGKKN